MGAGPRPALTGPARGNGGSGGGGGMGAAPTNLGPGPAGAGAPSGKGVGVAVAVGPWGVNTPSLKAAPKAVGGGGPGGVLGPGRGAFLPAATTLRPASMGPERRGARGGPHPGVEGGTVAGASASSAATALTLHPTTATASGGAHQPGQPGVPSGPRAPAPGPRAAAPPSAGRAAAHGVPGPTPLTVTAVDSDVRGGIAPGGTSQPPPGPGPPPTPTLRRGQEGTSVMGGFYDVEVLGEPLRDLGTGPVGLPSPTQETAPSPSAPGEHGAHPAGSLGLGGLPASGPPAPSVTAPLTGPMPTPGVSGPIPGPGCAPRAPDPQCDTGVFPSSTGTGSRVRGPLVPAAAPGQVRARAHGRGGACIEDQDAPSIGGGSDSGDGSGDGGLGAGPGPTVAQDEPGSGGFSQGSVDSGTASLSHRKRRRVVEPDPDPPGAQGGGTLWGTSGPVAALPQAAGGTPSGSGDQHGCRAGGRPPTAPATSDFDFA